MIIRKFCIFILFCRPAQVQILSSFNKVAPAKPLGRHMFTL
ncbi:hypothetical protein UYSO10_0608 [Kosakonia radicincitans]|nr:hypothetical protein UYSO10_0608 [Kosakonia radicincitans]